MDPMQMLQYILGSQGNNPEWGAMTGDPNSTENFPNGIPQNYWSPSMLNIPQGVQSLNAPTMGQQMMGGALGGLGGFGNLGAGPPVGGNGMANNGMPAAARMPTLAGKNISGIGVNFPQTGTPTPPVVPKPATPAPTPYQQPQTIFHENNGAGSGGSGDSRGDRGD
jgi:hypothetical protein